MFRIRPLVDMYERDIPLIKSHATIRLMKYPVHTYQQADGFETYDVNKYQRMEGVRMHI
jgi:hypothetical protein